MKTLSHHTENSHAATTLTQQAVCIPYTIIVQDAQK